MYHSLDTVGLNYLVRVNLCTQHKMVPLSPVEEGRRGGSSVLQSLGGGVHCEHYMKVAHHLRRGRDNQTLICIQLERIVCQGRGKVTTKASCSHNNVTWTLFTSRAQIMLSGHQHIRQQDGSCDHSSQQCQESCTSNTHSGIRSSKPSLSHLLHLIQTLTC